MKTPKALLGTATLFALSTAPTFAINFGQSRVSQGLQGSSNSADNAVQTIISNATSFLYLLAVIYGLYGGFKILTAGTDPKKVDEGKNIIFHSVLGLIVIFLASSIVQFVVNAILGGTGS